MFVDRAKIMIKSGKGGNGSVSFRREPFVPQGGPDGGDGGKGGDVIFKADEGLRTLMDFRYKRKYEAENGEDGKKKKCFGKKGADLVIRVPAGTVVIDDATGKVMKDLVRHGDSFVAAKGGKGGKGNVNFKNSVRQAPNFAEAGGFAVERNVTLVLKLIADVGLVGFPNVGKSTLLSVTSNARPKIANYHFTTLFPNLGVIYVDEGVSFVMADIPGIIEGAAEGAGLGHDFLRHIDRCRLLVHVVDVSGSEGRDPVEDFDAICEELANYSVDLSNRPMIVAANKCDLLMPESDNLERLRQHVEAAGCQLYEISAGTTQGTKNLMRVVAEKLRTLPPVTVYEPEYVEIIEEAGSPDDLTIEHLGSTWVVTGKWLERLIININFDDYESRNYFDLQLRKCGLFKKLEEMGIQDGDVVDIYDMEFEYQR